MGVLLPRTGLRGSVEFSARGESRCAFSSGGFHLRFDFVLRRIEFYNRPNVISP
jgi:hypothetical protein